MNECGKTEYGTVWYILWPPLSTLEQGWPVSLCEIEGFTKFGEKVDDADVCAECRGFASSQQIVAGLGR